MVAIVSFFLFMGCNLVADENAHDFIYFFAVLLMSADSPFVGYGDAIAVLMVILFTL